MLMRIILKAGKEYKVGVLHVLDQRPYQDHGHLRDARDQSSPPSKDDSSLYGCCHGPGIHPRTRKGRLLAHQVPKST